MTTPAKAPQEGAEEESVLVCVRVRPAGGADGEAGWTVDQTTIIASRRQALRGQL